MRKRTILGVAMALMASGVAIWWLAGRVDRAVFALHYGAVEAQLEAMRLLAGHVDDPLAFRAIVDWFESAAYELPSREMMAEASRAFTERQPTDDSFPPAVVALQIRGLFPEARSWVDDYPHAPAVTEALLRYLVTPPPSNWPGAEANLERELRARPRDSATLDLAIAAWRRGRPSTAVRFIETFGFAIVKGRVMAAASTPAQGQDEWRLLECQRGRCSDPDVRHLINCVRLDAAEQRLQANPSSWRGPLDAQRAALVSLGGSAVPALVALYDDSSSVLSSFAASTLAESDEPALMRRLAPDIGSVGAPAMKALEALQATPADSSGPNRLLMEALSSSDTEISNIALQALRQRLSEQDLVDGVLGYVANRNRFTGREVVAYEDAIKSAGLNAGDYVADTMTRMLDAAGDPRDLVWIQKVIALHVLRDVGTTNSLDILGRLRRDPGAYVWITTTVSDDGQRNESRRDVRFREAIDEAIEAINTRFPNS